MSTEVQPVDWLIVLGSRGPNLKTRAIAAAEMLRRGEANRAIISGGFTDDSGKSEAEEAQKIIEKVGIGSDRLVPEEDSYDTSTNFINARLLLDDVPGTVAVMTNFFHIPRAYFWARKQGIRARMIPAEAYLLKRSEHYKRVANRYGYPLSLDRLKDLFNGNTLRTLSWEILHRTPVEKILFSRSKQYREFYARFGDPLGLGVERDTLLIDTAKTVTLEGVLIGAMHTFDRTGNWLRSKTAAMRSGR